ncbi:MAG: hypothetical protein WA981_06530 [Glaciecola sp.]
MQTAAFILIPVIIIVLLVRLLKSNWFSTILIIMVLSASNVPISNYLYCNVVLDKCSTSGWEWVGYFFMWLYVSAGAIFAHFFIAGIIGIFNDRGKS